MTKEYVLTLDDYRLLQRRGRFPFPCSECSATCLCAVCESKKGYDAYIKEVEAANLSQLLALLTQVDTLLARKKDAQKKLEDVVSLLEAEYGVKNVRSISRNLYDSEI